MVHRNKTKAENGFTLVELIVVLAITAILAALVGGGLVAYTRLARFEKNESNARTLFQTAQIALTHEETAGGRMPSASRCRRRAATAAILPRASPRPTPTAIRPS